MPVSRDLQKTRIFAGEPKFCTFVKITIIVNRIPRLLAAAAALCFWTVSFAGTGVPELPDPNPADPSVWAAVKAPSFGWGSIDIRYPKTAPAATSTKAVRLEAWRGERVSAQAVLSAPAGFSSVKINASDLKSGRNVIPASAVSKYFVRYVLGDEKYHQQGVMLTADMLDPAPGMAVEARTSRPVWIEVKVPADAAPGLYKGTVSLDCDGATFRLPLQINVSSNLLPEPSEWAFHLDLWQNPYAVARYYGVPLWSEEHFARMRPLMEMYAAAGGKVITASIISRPWNGQTYDPFETMIGKFKQIDGGWKYDYSVFDKWVAFAISCGVDAQIDCYTLVPWSYKFEYYDCATGCVRQVACSPQEPAYRELILPFLKDFAAHLKARGWFDRTCIAMDERPMEQMAAALAVVKEADPGFRIEGAANYNVDSSSADGIYDMSVCYEFNLLKAEAVERRRAAGQKLTFYTCCNPVRPNTFTFSDPAESAFLGWHAAAAGYDGYLRWALNSWTEEPLQDSRYPAKNWSSGDCYLVYPGGSSIRFERLVEGIQDYEKIRILRRSASAEKVAAFEAVLAEHFLSPQYDDSRPAAFWLAKGKEALRKLER